MLKPSTKIKKIKPLTTNVEIVNELGLHTRAAAKFVTLASNFKSEVSLSKGKQKINAKSIMGILLLAAGKGTKLKLEVMGVDQEKAIEALANLIKNGFGE